MSATTLLGQLGWLSRVLIHGRIEDAKVLPDYRVELPECSRTRSPGTAVAASRAMTVTTIMISASAIAARAHFVNAALINICDSKPDSKVTKKIDKMRASFLSKPKESDCAQREAALD